MVIWTTAEHPVIFALWIQNRDVVAGRKPRGHEPLTVEFPVLIAVGAIPVIRLVVPLVSEAYGDPVSGQMALEYQVIAMYFVGLFLRFAIMNSS